MEGWINEAAITDPETVEQIIEEISAETIPNAKVATGVTRHDLAKMLNISAETIDRWRRMGCPYKSHGNSRASEWNPVDCFRWYLAQKKHSHNDEESKHLDRETKREILLAKKIKRQQLAGELVRAEVVRAEVQQYVEMLRNIGSSLESKFGPEALGILNEGLDEINSQIQRQS